MPIFDIGGTASIPDQSPAACFSGPMLDLWSGPQANAALTEIDDRPGHIGIAVQIRCDAVPVRQSQQARDALAMSGRSNLDFETWVSMDIDYIERSRPALDLALLVKTIRRCYRVA